MKVLMILLCLFDVIIVCMIIRGLFIIFLKSGTECRDLPNPEA